MRTKEPQSIRQQGFSLIELLIVVAIIIIMVAVALPNIAGYLRNYKIKGAAQQVAGELQQARMKAITQNANLGITFAIVDADSYRWVSDDAQARGDNPYIGPLYDLPAGVRFDPVSVAGSSVALRFNRLGTACVPGASNCGIAFPVTFSPATESARVTISAGANYFEPVGTMWRVTLREQTTNMVRRVRIEPGGRVSSQQ